MSRLTAIVRRFRCRFGWHKGYDVIQTFGAAQHIGCPDCGCQFGIHHGVRSIIPWDEDLASMYTDFGYDVGGPLNRWKARRALGGNDG